MYSKEINYVIEELSDINLYLTYEKEICSIIRKEKMGTAYMKRIKEFRHKDIYASAQLNQKGKYNGYGILTLKGKRLFYSNDAIKNLNIEREKLIKELKELTK